MKQGYHFDQREKSHYQYKYVDFIFKRNEISRSARNDKSLQMTRKSRLFYLLPSAWACIPVCRQAGLQLQELIDGNL